MRTHTNVRNYKVLHNFVDILMNVQAYNKFKILN